MCPEYFRLEGTKKGRGVKNGRTENNEQAKPLQENRTIQSWKQNFRHLTKSQRN